MPPDAKWRFPGRAFALAAALQLGACTMVGPDFVRPKVPWLGEWSSEGLRQAERGEVRNRPATDEWWRNFNDAVLDSLVAEAQVLNPGVRTAGMRIMEARAQLGIARSGLYPQLNQLNASALRTGTRSSSGPSTALWAYGASYDVAWELDFWGKYRRGIEAADAGYFASVAQYDDVQVLVAAQAASLYGSIRTIELRLRIAEENAALQKRMPRDHRAIVPQRQRLRARRAAGENAVPRHAGAPFPSSRPPCARRRTRFACCLRGRPVRCRKCNPAAGRSPRRPST